MPALSNSLRLPTAQFPRGGVPEFPLIASLVARWEADQITGLTNGDPIATWPDASGNNRHLTQSTPAARPLWNASDPTFNHRPTVTFDGLNDSLSNLNMPEMGTAVTVIDVMKVIGEMPGFGKTIDFHAIDLTVDGPTNICGFYGPHAYKISVGNVGTTEAVQTYLTTAFVARAVFTDALVKHQVSGSAETSADSGAMVAANTVEHFMASNGGASGFVPCTIAARFIFNTDLSSEELAALLDYIEGKYDVTL